MRGITGLTPLPGLGPCIRVGERPVVLDLLSLARALSHLGDRAAWLAVLRAPWCGLTLADLHALVADAPERSIVDLLRDGAWRERLGDAARAALERTWPTLDRALGELRQLGIRDTVERVWHSLGGPATFAEARSLEEAEAFFEVLADAERRDRAALDVSALGRALEHLYAPTAPDPAVRIELSTIHKAKGLQFDTVIIPGLERLPREDEDRLLLWTTQIADGHAGLVVAPLAHSGIGPNVLYDWLRRQERAKLQQERRRLLYVAMTRAKETLDLIVPQRFFVRQQSAYGDRHVYALRSRFIPNALVRLFECCASPVALHAEEAPPATAPVAVDIASRVRARWATAK